MSSLCSPEWCYAIARKHLGIDSANTNRAVRALADDIFTAYNEGILEAGYASRRHQPIIYTRNVDHYEYELN